MNKFSFHLANISNIDCHFASVIRALLPWTFRVGQRRILTCAATKWTMLVVVALPPPSGCCFYRNSSVFHSHISRGSNGGRPMTTKGPITHQQLLGLLRSRGNNWRWQRQRWKNKMSPFVCSTHRSEECPLLPIGSVKAMGAHTANTAEMKRRAIAANLVDGYWRG